MEDETRKAVRAFIKTRLQQGKQGDELPMCLIYRQCRSWVQTTMASSHVNAKQIPDKLIRCTIKESFKDAHVRITRTKAYLVKWAAPHTVRSLKDLILDSFLKGPDYSSWLSLWKNEDIHMIPIELRSWMFCRGVQVAPEIGERMWYNYVVPLELRVAKCKATHTIDDLCGSKQPPSKRSRIGNEDGGNEKSKDKGKERMKMEEDSSIRVEQLKQASSQVPYFEERPLPCSFAYERLMEMVFSLF